MITEHDDLSSVLKAVIPDTLVLFDLDNTLIKNREYLGSPEWFTYFYRKLQNSGAPEEAHAEALATYLAVNQVAQVELVCETAPNVLEELKKTTYVGVLTAREVALRDVTLTHMREKNLVLSDSWKGDKSFPLQTSVKGCFTQGVIFAGGGDKGRCLLEVLEKIHPQPPQIVFG